MSPLIVTLLLVLCAEGLSLTAPSALSMSMKLNSNLSRARFLSAGAAAFVASAPAAADDQIPRYVDQDISISFADDEGNIHTQEIYVERITGDGTPYQFPVRPIPLTRTWPDLPPFRPEDFLREDSSDDAEFYSDPRLIYHLDEAAVSSLTQFYRNNIPPGSDLLDIMSSWVSHYPLEFERTMKTICATGMNSFELRANNQVKHGCMTIQDLNAEQGLPYGDNSFDVITCVVSIDYLTEPIAILREVRRILRPGGKLIISQSNRYFASKAINMWLKMDDRQHLDLIDGYLKYTGGFEEREAFDITAIQPNDAYGDPMYVVVATKL